MGSELRFGMEELPFSKEWELVVSEVLGYWLDN